MNGHPPCLLGFTLLELAIVLLIVGALAGGVLVGREVLKTAQLRNVISNVEAFTAATKGFQQKYNCIPGDCANAGDMWGVINADPDTCNSTLSASGTLTCNGNGDGHLTTAETLTAGVPYENFRFRQQLGNAGFIAGKFTGGGYSATASGLTTAVPGTNIPATSFNSTVGYQVNWHGAGFTGDTNYWGYSNTSPARKAIYGHSFLVGTDTSASGTLGYGPMRTAFKAEEAYYIDKKTDDSNPVQGRIIALRAPAAFRGVPPCVDPAVSYDNYNIAAGGSCAIIFADRF